MFPFVAILFHGPDRYDKLHNFAGKIDQTPAVWDGVVRRDAIEGGFRRMRLLVSGQAAVVAFADDVDANGVIAPVQKSIDFVWETAVWNQDIGS